MPVKPIPEGYHTVTPLLSVKGAARLIDFMKKAFGATENYRFPAPDGSRDACGAKDRRFVCDAGRGDEGPSHVRNVLCLRAGCRRDIPGALSAGGESLEGPTDQFWGDRVATIKDFAGNKWMIATHVEDVSADELERRARKLMAA